MSEGMGGSPKGEGAAPEAGGMPVQAGPVAKRFFLVEYLDEVRRGFTWMRTAPKPDQPITKKVQKGLIKWSKLRKARVGMVVLVVIVAASYGLFSVQAGSTPVVDPRGPVGPGPTGENLTATFTGRVAEDGNVSHGWKDLTVGVFATFRATLTWSDEAAGTFLTNQPDELGLEVRAPNGMNWSRPMTTTSGLTWNLEDVTLDYGVGEWTFVVLGGTMGDITRAGGGTAGCVRCGPDTGNDYTLLVEAAW